MARIKVQEFGVVLYFVVRLGLVLALFLIAMGNTYELLQLD